MSSAAAPREPVEPVYMPRQMSSLGIWDIGGWRFKTYLIRANTRWPVSDAMIAAARMKIAAVRDSLEATAHFNTGFVVLHEGVEGIWLLTHWWTKGGICAELLWHATADHPATFEEVDQPLMACVWELVPIDFERRAWVDTVLKPGGGGLVAYLRTTMPDGTY
ncbi:MAG: hypothetical protein ABL898_11430 [Hyphomicrobiaceae bacterium]|nr:hypothetical protein [Hyphomicrobiaceae bacterium]